MVGLFPGLQQTAAAAGPFFKGAEACEECHENDFAVWKKTKHYTNFKSFDKDAKTKDMPQARRRAESRKRTCVPCHYTMVQKDGGKEARAQSGTSCESCHGPSSGYLEPHADKKLANRRTSRGSSG
jgi:hypothetical protein